MKIFNSKLEIENYLLDCHYFHEKIPTPLLISKTFCIKLKKKEK